MEATGWKKGRGWRPFVALHLRSSTRFTFQAVFRAKRRGTELLAQPRHRRFPVGKDWLQRSLCAVSALQVPICSIIRRSDDEKRREAIDFAAFLEMKRLLFLFCRGFVGFGCRSFFRAFCVGFRGSRLRGCGFGGRRFGGGRLSARAFGGGF